MDYDDDDQSSATGSVPPPPPAVAGGGGGGGVDDVTKQSNDADNDDENTQQQSSPTSSSQKKILSLGGRSDKKCFALLDGIFEDPEHPETRTRVTIPITRLPAILGRTHDTDDPHFFGLGKKKALSRKQCLIEYRVTGKDGNKDGRVEWDDKKQKLVYKEKDGDSTKEKNKDKDKDDENPRDIDIDVDDLPSNGYFAIGSMGKNRITVDQERIAHGKVALLKSGTPIRISSYCLYFLLPTDAPPLEHTIPSAPSSSQAAATTKKKKRKKGSSLQPDAAPSSDPAASQKKAKTATTTTTTTTTTTGGGSTTGNLQSEIDSMSVEELMDRMTEAIRNNEWDRKHQIMGTAISMHAVRAVATDPSIQAMAMNDGVSRKAILDWIEKSDKYGDWVDLMLSKMELRSYQAAVTKSLIKSGYTKTGGFGRYVKWFLPKDIPIVVKKGAARSSVGGGSDEEPNDDDDDNDDGDQDDEDDDKEEEDDDDDDEEGEGDGNDEEQNEEEEEEEEEEAEQNGADDEEEHDGEGTAPGDDDESSDDDDIPF